jgi:hypothetical protein
MPLHIHLYTLYVYISRASLHFIAYDIMRKNICSAEAEGDGIGWVSVKIRHNLFWLFANAEIIHGKKNIK